jgi:PhnB protein
MAAKVKPVPQGYRTVTPYLTVNDAARAIDFYKRAFNAQEVMRMGTPNGKIAHAEIKIGDSLIMLGDEMPQGTVKAPQSVGGTTAGIFLYVENVDESFNQAVSAGAQPEAKPSDMFWGDRFGTVRDPFGHHWSMATHIEDVAPADMKQRMQEAMAKMGQQSQGGAM